jgi:hypothetical protein
MLLRGHKLIPACLPACLYVCLTDWVQPGELSLRRCAERQMSCGSASVVMKVRSWPVGAWRLIELGVTRLLHAADSNSLCHGTACACSQLRCQ